jgi:hypothetical protein
MNEEPTFDHEKLDVYQIELLFVAWWRHCSPRFGAPRRDFIARLRSA